MEVALAFVPVCSVGMRFVYMYVYVYVCVCVCVASVCVSVLCVCLDIRQLLKLMKMVEVVLQTKNNEKSC